ncbi:MAG: ATP-binding cassette domain-containing protein [Phycisphaerae bacterium]|nr:ATP-binding cassette domain-containing protein [Phycisphaerae bacterium]
MIRIRELVKTFGRSRAVDGVSIDIAEGQSVALWGGNGAGKTTIIRCVLGLFRFGGTIEVGGLDVRRSGKRARRLIGYVPQELGFYDELRAAEAVRFFARLKGLRSRNEGEALGHVGLVGHEHKRVRELSGGMKQRLALAIALLGDPPILILDEVTASLDACGRDELVQLLSRLSRGGRTMLFASHRVEEVSSLANRVVMLERGRAVGECGVESFMPRLGLSTLLHLHIVESARVEAMTTLRAHGFAPRLNGVGLMVPVPAEQKAAPFRVLAQARIAVDDFELIRASEVGGVHPTQEVAS